MQITLVQNEIEQAIRNYIHSQINVREGMKIDIALKATRGEEGTTAIIDIVPEELTASVAQRAPAPAVTKKIVPASAPAASTGDTQNLPSGNAAASTAGATNQTAELASATGEGAGDKKEDPPFDANTTGTASAGGAASLEAGNGEAAVQQPKTSLFANMQRPKNG